MVFHRATVIIRLVVVTSVVKGTQRTWHSVSVLSWTDSRLTTTSMSAVLSWRYLGGHELRHD